MRMMRSLAPAAALVFAVACGGSKSSPEAPSGPSTATGLAYTGPTVPAGAWSILQDTVSGDTITFKVMGPAGATNVRGFSFTLVTDPSKASWARVGGEWAQEAGLLNLGDPALATDPKLKIASHREAKLVFGAYQKTEALPAVNVGGQAVYRFALKLGAGLTVGEKIPLTVEKANFLPEDLSSIQRPYTPSLPAMTVAVGALSAK